jgi:hypothetical protein
MITGDSGKAAASPSAGLHFWNGNANVNGLKTPPEKTTSAFRPVFGL